MDIDQKHSFHSISADETLEKLASEENGLSSDKAKKGRKNLAKM